VDTAGWVYVGIFGVIAAGFGALYWWKVSSAKKLLGEADAAIARGQPGAAMAQLKEGLWRANEKGALERAILERIEALYRREGVRWGDGGDYRTLIAQFEQLSRADSHAAIEEMKEVQTLKQKLIERMPTLPDEPSRDAYT